MSEKINNYATNRDLKKITDHAIKAKQQMEPGKCSKEYRRLAIEQRQMMDQIKRERGS